MGLLKNWRAHSRLLQSGFSLAELMTVLAVISILAALSFPSVASFNQSAALKSAGNGLVDLATFAHDYALSHNATTALVGVTSSSNASSAQYRAFVVLANNQGVWSQVSNWYRLPQSTVMSSSNANTFLSYQNGGGYSGNYPQTFLVPSTSASALTFRGTPVNNSDNTGFAYLIFFPDGHIDTTGSSAINMRLVNSQNQATGSPADYYDLIFNPMTGTVKISQP